MLLVHKFIGQAYSHLQNEGKLRSTIQSSDTLEVLRAAPVGGEGQPVFERISSEDLVPGDVVSIPAYGCELHFDGVVISGSVIVNESLLTGECVPVTKVSQAGFPIYIYIIRLQIHLCVKLELCRFLKIRNLESQFLAN